MQIIDVLEYIHGNGYSHGDINPDNIMISDGNAFLVDYDFNEMANMPNIKRRRSWPTMEDISIAQETHIEESELAEEVMSRTWPIFWS